MDDMHLRHEAFLREIDQVRALQQVGELRVADGEEHRQLTGHFSVTDVWYEIDSFFEGRFLERVSPGAFRKTLSEQRDNIKCLYDHGMDPSIGNKVLGRVVGLDEDGTGARYEVDLFDTSYNADLLPGLRAGVYGSSFRFKVIKDRWDHTPTRSERNPDGIPERTILELRVFEFGPVTFPASPSATAGVRSLTDDYYRRSDSDRHDLLSARAREVCTPDPGAASTSAEAAPSEGHSDGVTQSARRAIARRKVLAAKGLTSPNTKEDS